MRIPNIFQLFKQKRYKKISIHQHHLMIDTNFDIGLREYYQYVTQLMLEALSTQSTQRPSQLLKLGIHHEAIFQGELVKNIDFQVEHTLVKPGGRGSESAPIGKTVIDHSVDNFYTVRIQNIDYLVQQDLIIEYSRPNIKHVQNSGLYSDYLKKICLITPTLYPINEGLILNQVRNINTITLFRDINQPRRKEFLSDLDSHYVPLKNMDGIFKDLDQIYFNTKILINIRQTDHHDTLEELRILPALRCGVIIICEEAPLKKYCRYSDFIIWGKLENLPNIILDVQNNYGAYHQNIFNAKFFSRMKRLEKSNQLRCNDSVKSLIQ